MPAATTASICPGSTITGPALPEPVEVHAVAPMGSSARIMGVGRRTGNPFNAVLTADQLAALEVMTDRVPFDGDARKFRLGIEAHRLGLAHEYDPFFSLSIARVDPLPHQLEAVYEYFLKLPRIRFLLADDPGAGKTVMAGLLIKELKARGLAKRILIVAPANLTFQWQRELADKFREKFEIIRGVTLRANYGQNPWQENDQVVTSVSWAAIQEDARESLLRSRWDLVIVDEAHKMSARSEDHSTYAYRLGKSLSEMTDHYLLMTATPHKGDPEHFQRFLALLDGDVYGDIESLKAAMASQVAPFYLRRIKEALTTFPDPETGIAHKLFRKREVRSADFEVQGAELDFYDALTHYVEDQSVQAAGDTTARGRAVGFQMAMLQRRMASSVYAVRKTLERMKERREKILADPEKYRKEQVEARIPDDIDDYDEEEQEKILAKIEAEVLSYDPTTLRGEIADLTKLIEQARKIEASDDQTKLGVLKALLREEGVFSDPQMKLLIFTEHKDTLDYLAGDGKDGRPVGKLREWGLTVTQIHGGMKIGDRDTPGTRIYAEREFRESAQVLVATEAAGEGINLQFCWLMVNYDIPWSPVRLEQRIGRIHRYGQEHDCLVFNFVARNTREGRVLTKLLNRLAEIRRALGTDNVFDVVGEVFPSNMLEKLLRDMYAKRTDAQAIEDRIARDVSEEKFRVITDSALEGLAKKNLNLTAITSKNAEAKERRLVPEVVRDFFVDAAPECGIAPKAVTNERRIYRLGKIPRSIVSLGDEAEARFGRIGRDYDRVIFDKNLLKTEATAEWVTPGHALFEAVRRHMLNVADEDLRRGAVFYSLRHKEPTLVDVFAASVKDGNGNTLQRRLFCIATSQSGTMTAHEPTMFLDVAAAPEGTKGPTADTPIPARSLVETFLYQHCLEEWGRKAAADRIAEIERVRRHVKISLDTLINRQQILVGTLTERRDADPTLQGIDGQISAQENHLDTLNARLEKRLKELTLEEQTFVADIQPVARAWIMPHPERDTPEIKPMVRDDEIEKIAVRIATEHEEARGWVVESVETENRGFDLISRQPHPEDPKTSIAHRFIEVKGRAGVGGVVLSENEYRKANLMKEDYWLYAVFNCATTPKLEIVQNPATLGWTPITKVEHYQVGAEAIRGASQS
jgi:superfamily II DNA or RNA helicase